MSGPAPGAPAPYQPAGAAPPDRLRRLHPLSPLVRGWKWLAAVGAVSGQRFYGDVDLRGLAVLVGVLVPLAAAYGYVSWRYTRYVVGTSDLRLETGVLFRRSRRVRLDRLQAVDVVRPLLARALGLAELRLEVVGAGSAEAPLAYLSEPDAHRLRSELLARAAGLQPDTPEAPERVLLRVPPLRLAASAVLSVPVLLGVVGLVALLGGLLATSELLDGVEVIAGLGVVVPLVGAVLGPVYAQFLRFFDFTLAESPDGLRLRYGLAETRAQTVPPGRVQAVRIVRPPLWRPFGWARLEVNIAGYAGSGAAIAPVLLPVAPAAEVRAVLARALPGLDIDAVPLAAAPRRARRLDPVDWRQLAVGADGQFFLIRRGRLRRELDVVPHGKVQSVRCTQGPLQRRLRLATVHLDSTPGPVRPVAEHRDVDEAAQLVRAQAQRALAARAAAGPEQWMVGPQ